MATGLAVVFPFFLLGNPSGHDFEFHMHSWMEVLSQWHTGIFYPRWAALAQYGYGEARFIFYPPASWTLGAALGAILPWKAVPGAYVWLALTFAGCSMFLLARQWLSRRDAIFAAVLYAANPYFLLIVYWRSAFAELLAGALLPLLLLYLFRVEEIGSKAVVPLGLVLAGVWLTNAPSAVMAHYSLALLALTLTIVRRSPRIIGYVALAVLLGAALAAFYILPAGYEQKWASIGMTLVPGVRPQDNFLFTTIHDPDHNRFNLLVSLVALLEILLFAAVAFSSRNERHRQPKVWWMLVVWASAATFLMSSVSFFLWQHLPLLRFLQLPWRWLLCLNVALALYMSLSWKRWWYRGLAWLIMLGALLFISHRTQPPWWDNAAAISAFHKQHETGAGYEGADEYVPVDADADSVRHCAALVALGGGGTAQVQMLQWGPETKLFVADAAQPGKLVLRLFNYPAWRVEVNGHVVEAETQDDTGQMLIPISAGQNRVELSFVRTRDRTAGGMISLLTATGLMLSWRRRVSSSSMALVAERK